jgi:hypothetical protein
VRASPHVQSARSINTRMKKEKQNAKHARRGSMPPTVTASPKNANNAPTFRPVLFQPMGSLSFALLAHTPTPWDEQPVIFALPTSTLQTVIRATAPVPPAPLGTLQGPAMPRVAARLVHNALGRLTRTQRRATMRVPLENASHVPTGTRATTGYEGPRVQQGNTPPMENAKTATLDPTPARVSHRALRALQVRVHLPEPPHAQTARLGTSASTGLTPRVAGDSTKTPLDSQTA